MANAGAIRAGRACVEAFLENSAFMRSLNQMDRTLKAWGTRFTAWGGTLLKAGIGLAAPFAFAVSSASDLEETMNKFNVVFGESAAEVKAWSDNFGAQMGRSKKQIADFMAGTQDLLVPIGFDPKTATDFSKQITQLSVDLASFNNMQDSDTLRDLHAALTGSGEVMKKYGVIVSEAAVKQELMNKGIDKDKATELQKVQARMAIILRGTTAAQGDAARSSGSFANQMKALQANVADAAAEVGTALLPTVTRVVTGMSSAIKQATQWVSANQGLAVAIAGVAAGLIAGGVALMAFGGLLSMAGSVATTIGSMLSGLAAVATTVGGVLVSAVGGALAFLASPIGIAVAAVAALAAGVLYFSGLGSQIMSGLGGAFDSIKTEAMSAFETIKADGAEALDGIKAALASGDIGAAFGIVFSLISLEWTRGVAMLQGIWNGFKTWFMTIGMSAFTGAAQLFNDAWSGVELVFEESVNFLQGVWEGFTGFLSRTWNSTVGFIQKAWVRMKSVFQDIDVQAEIRKIDAQTTDKNETSRKSQDQVAQERQDRQQQRRDQIESDRQGANDELQRQLEQSVADMATANAEALRQAEEDVRAAREKLATAVSETKAAAEKKASEAAAKVPPAAATDSPELKASASKISVASTFDASIASRLGAGSGMAERTAKATERTAKAAEKTEEGIADLNEKMNKPVSLVYA